MKKRRLEIIFIVKQILVTIKSFIGFRCLVLFIQRCYNMKSMWGRMDSSSIINIVRVNELFPLVEIIDRKYN